MKLSSYRSSPPERIPASRPHAAAQPTARVARCPGRFPGVSVITDSEAWLSSAPPLVSYLYHARMLQSLYTCRMYTQTPTVPTVTRGSLRLHQVHSVLQTTKIQWFYSSASQGHPLSLSPLRLSAAAPILVGLPTRPRSKREPTQGEHNSMSRQPRLLARLQHAPSACRGSPGRPRGLLHACTTSPTHAHLGRFVRRCRSLSARRQTWVHWQLGGQT